MKNPPKLKKWRGNRSLREAAITIRSFMKNSKFTSTSLANYENGDTEPLVTTAVAIDKATSGKVSVWDWG